MMLFVIQLAPFITRTVLVVALTVACLNTSGRIVGKSEVVGVATRMTAAGGQWLHSRFCSSISL
jgi:hypothetical protein